MSDLREAREFYFAAGGVESDLGPRSDAEWYWRRAAKAWREKAESATRSAQAMAAEVDRLHSVEEAWRRDVELWRREASAARAGAQAKRATSALVSLVEVLDHVLNCKECVVQFHDRHGLMKVGDWRVCQRGADIRAAYEEARGKRVEEFPCSPV